jgi:hypothetical protein
MVAQKIRTAHLPKHNYGDFKKKAEEFFNVMFLCLEDRQWDAAVLNGVHAAISITDAILVNKKEIKSISQRHEDAVGLLKQEFTAKELAGQNHRLSRVLNFKNLVSYQPIILGEAAARDFAKNVERYFGWAKKCYHKGENSYDKNSTGLHE